MNAGEWYENDSLRVRIVGKRLDGKVITETHGGFIGSINDKSEWTHLPDCDSFYWKPETFPQWYAKSCGGPYADCDHIIRTSKTTLCGVLADGTKTKEVPWEKYHEEFVIEGSWVPLTQAEAEDRIKIQDPINLINLMNCPDCGEFRGHSHEEICKAKAKPNYVRLWTHRTSGTVCTATDERYLKYPDIWTEIKHDGTGFYLVDQQR